MPSLNPDQPEQIVAELAPLIRQHADAAEANRRLAPEVATALIEAGVFQTWVPKALGGLELDPMSALRMFEAFGTVDGSVAWVVSNSVHASEAVQVLPDQGAEELLSSGRSLFAIAGFPPGAAVPVDGGYRVTSRAPFGSGSEYCTALIGLSAVMAGDAMQTGPDGAPVMVLTYAKREDVEIIDTWHTYGMCATGSHDVALTNVFIPHHRAFLVGPFEVKNRYMTGPLYRVGFWLDTMRIGAVALGIAEASLSDAIELARTKVPANMMIGLADKSVVQDQVARARAKLTAARDSLYVQTEKAWNVVQDGSRLNVISGPPVALAALNALHTSMQVVNTVQEIVGTTGIRTEYQFQRRYRDINTMAQHFLGSASRFESLGKLLLGKETDMVFYNL